MLISTANFMEAQDLKKHRWRQRVIIILTENRDNALFNEQVSELEKHLNGLEARKLIVYQLSPKSYKINFSEANQWIENTSLYENFSKTELPFQVLLIGLDGSIKLRQAKLLSAASLFETIDAMPMRRTEMRRKD